MSTNKENLHRLIDQLPEDLAGELLHFGEYLQAKRALAGEGEQPSEEDRAWMAAGLEGLGDRLAEIEADVPPAELEAWRASFEQGAKPCEYVPGRGFVVKP